MKTRAFRDLAHYLDGELDLIALKAMGADMSNQAMSTPEETLQSGYSFSAGYAKALETHHILSYEEAWELHIAMRQRAMELLAVAKKGEYLR